MRIKSRTPSPETEELKRLRKLKEIQVSQVKLELSKVLRKSVSNVFHSFPIKELVVKDSEKFVAEPPDKDQFEYDKM